MSGDGAELRCTVLANGRAVAVVSRIELAPLDMVEFDGDAVMRVIARGDMGPYTRAIGSIIDSLGIPGNVESLPAAKDPRYGEVVSGMGSAVGEVAGRLAKAFISGAPIIVHYHNDGDGATAAIALHRGFGLLVERGLCDGRQASWQMSRGVAYTYESLYTDRMLFQPYTSAERPLIVILDFGTTPESNGAMAAAAGSYDIVWIDHHVIPDGFVRQGEYLNPFDHGGDSRLSAGLVASAAAEAMGARCTDIAEASLISDYSPYADRADGRAVRIATALDYLTSRGEYGGDRPKRMDEIVRDEAELGRVYANAKGKMDEALEAGLRTARRYAARDGTKVAALDFKHVAKLGLDYPLPGRYSSRLQERLEKLNRGGTVTIVYYGRYISIRVSADVAKRVNILGMISRLSEGTGGRLTGGGHMEAASIRIGDYDMQEAVALLLNELGAA